MSIIQINSLSKRFNTDKEDLFSNINLNIDASDHIGLIGPNGCGKSTLLRIIKGLENADSGSVSLAKNCIISYYSQIDDTVNHEQTVLFNENLYRLQQQLQSLEEKMSKSNNNQNLDKLLNEYQDVQNKFHLAGSYDYEAKLLQILSSLGFDNSLAESKISTLSGGERARVRLAKLLLNDSDVLLLDEPSNHLDIDGIDWLTSYLKQLKKTVVLVSHDRYILDSVCNKIASFESKNLYLYKGNYSAAIKQREERGALFETSIKNLESKIEHEEKVRQTLLSHRKISSYHARDRVVKKLKAELESLKAKSINKDKKIYIGNIDKPEIRHDNKRLLLDFKNLSLAFNRPLFSNFNGHICADDKIAILGPNGCGKSSLIKVFMADLLPDTGRINIVANPEIAYMGQHVFLSDNENITVLEYFSSVSSISDISKLRARLANFAFFTDDLDKKISVLSGGERQRLYLAQLLEMRPDLIILDEPTNHLDINSRELLEKALMEYTGALLIVSHDRYFVEKLTTKVWGFIDYNVIEFDAYSAWLKLYREERLSSNGSNNKLITTSIKKSISPFDALVEDNERNESINSMSSSDTSKAQESGVFAKYNIRSNLPPSERRKRLANLRTELSKIESEIFDLENQHERFLEESTNNKLNPDDYRKYNESLNRLEELYTRYYEISELLEKIK